MFVVFAVDASCAAEPFVHPGLLHSRAELVFIKQKLAASEEPWKSAWDELQLAEGASFAYIPKPFANVVLGVRNSPNIGSSDMSNDAVAAYAHALQWCLTGNQQYATKATEILNAWSATLESVSGHARNCWWGWMASHSAMRQN